MDTQHTQGRYLPYLAGLMDGEGSFSIQIQRRGKEGRSTQKTLDYVAELQAEYQASIADELTREGQRLGLEY